MNIPERGLGRGLSSLLSSATESGNEETRKLALTQLVPGKHQPRKVFDSNALGELAVSIKNQGVIQPLLVRLLPGMPQRYEIVAGERRWRAARMAGLTEVPVIVTEYTDKEAMTVALVENLQREDLNPMEEAEALQALREAHGLSQEALAEQIVREGLSVRQAEQLAKKLSAKKPPKARPAADPEAALYLRDAEKSLSGRLGRRVRILPGRKKGRVELEYYNEEDLEALLALLGRGGGGL